LNYNNHLILNNMLSYRNGLDSNKEIDLTDCEMTEMGLLAVTSAIFLKAKSFR
jgi:hypothetical protein